MGLSDKMSKTDFNNYIKRKCNEDGKMNYIASINRDKYRFTKDLMCDIHYLKNTKTEYKKQMSKMRRLLRELDEVSYSYIVENINTDTFIRGSFKSMLCNLSKVMQNEYTYNYNGKKYTKSFSKNRVIRWIESMNILLGEVDIVNPFIKVCEFYSLIDKLKENKNDKIVKLTEKIVFDNVNKIGSVYDSMRYKIMKNYVYDKSYIDNKYDFLRMVEA
jgi:hypothetical protein